LKKTLTYQAGRRNGICNRENFVQFEAGTKNKETIIEFDRF